MNGDLNMAHVGKLNDVKPSLLMLPFSNKEKGFSEKWMMGADYSDSFKM
jgi:hypothetical protein